MDTKKNILVMDDDPNNRAHISELIRFLGFNVECVNSLNAAMHRLRDTGFDGLLLDMWMEDGNGRDVLKWLRENGRQEPVVLMSATADYEQWIDLVNHGAADLLPKPVEPMQLKRSLQIALGEQYFNGERGWQPTMGV